MSDAGPCLAHLVALLDAQIAVENDRGTEAFRARDMRAIEQILARIQELDGLQRDVIALQQRWAQVLPAAVVVREEDAASPDDEGLRNAAHDAGRGGLAVREKPAEVFEVDGVEVPEESNAVDQGPARRHPRRFYYRIILESLEQIGGRGRLETVIAMVGKAMEGRLTSADLQPTEHTSEVSWRNSVRWARQDLVMRGFILKGSPAGIWEISDAGRRWLAEQPRGE